MSKIIAVIIGAIGLIGLIVALAFLFSIPLLLLWNWLMPVIFGLKEITWVQSIGILMLSGILFKSGTPIKS